MTKNVFDLSAYTGGESGGEPPSGAGTPLPAILTLDQLRAQSRATTWVVKHTLPADSVGMMFGASGTFKSFIAIDLALHVVHGLPWRGKKTIKGPVLFVAAEGGMGLWRRILAWHSERGLKWDIAPIYVLPQAINLGADATLVQQATEALGIVPTLVVIDTMAQTFVGEENSATEVGKYLRELGLYFRETWHAAVVIVHHTGHQATERPRGSSALHSTVDFLFGVFRDETEMLATLECLKLKEDEKFAPMSFSLKVVDLAVDDDGDAIRTLVASEIGREHVVRHMTYEAERGRGGRNHLFLELAVNGMEERKVRTLFCEAIDGLPDAKRRSYYRARRWAIAAGIIEIAQGYILRLGVPT